MKMTTTPAPAILAVVLSASALVVAGASGATRATPAAEHFTLTEADAVKPTHTSNEPVSIHVVATGPISGRGNGTLQTIPAGGNVDHVTLRLAKGSVSLVATETFSAVRPDLRACVGKLTGRGRFRITSGTGAYAGAAGSGTYTRTGILVGRRDANGVCLGRKAPPKASTSTVKMSGTVTLG